MRRIRPWSSGGRALLAGLTLAAVLLSSSAPRATLAAPGGTRRGAGAVTGAPGHGTTTTRPRATRPGHATRTTLRRRPTSRPARLHRGRRPAAAHRLTPRHAVRLAATADVTATSPLTLSVPTVERQLLSVLSQVQNSTLPSTTQADLLHQLAPLAAQLQSAEGLSRQLDTQNAGLAVLVQAKIDGLAAIDKIDSDLQINLDQLQANVDASANANVDATVGGISVTVGISADQVQADLGASADHLLVDLTADLDVLKVVTLHGIGHVDVSQLEVTLHALVTKLTLDLEAVLQDLHVLATADVQAALSAAAQLRANITAQVSGVHAQVAADYDSKIALQGDTSAALTDQLSSLLGSVSANLTALQQQL